MSFTISERSNIEQISRTRKTTASLVEYANEKRKIGVFNDVEICCGSVKCQANKMVLSCFSGFFEKMFTTEMKEKYQTSVEIEKVDGELMKNLISFLYCGTIDINTDKVCDLLSTAHYLQMDDVIQFCFEYLQSAMTPDNCLLIHKIAKHYERYYVIDVVEEFISENFDDVASSDDYKNFSKQDVLEILLWQDRSVVKESSIYNAVVGWTQHEVENRVKQFPDMLETVQLHKLPSQFLQEVVAKETLITSNLKCSNMLIEGFSKHTHKLSLKETDTRLLCFGGNEELQEVFNCLDEPPIKYPALPEYLHYGCSEKLGDNVYYIGGESENGELKNSVWRMNLKDQNLKWNKEISLPQSLSEMAIATFKESIVIFGGKIDKHFICKGFYFNAIQGEWKELGFMNFCRQFHSLVCCNNQLYAIGGSGHHRKYFPSARTLSSVERYNTFLYEWTNDQPMLIPREQLSAVSHDGYIYAIGGRSEGEGNSALGSVERFDVATKTWSYVKKMQHARRGCAACVLQGKIYVVGGVDEEDKKVNEIECYDPSADEWSTVGMTDSEDELIGHSLVVV